MVSGLSSVFAKPTHLVLIFGSNKIVKEIDLHLVELVVGVMGHLSRTSLQAMITWSADGIFWNIMHA